jgi:molybdopterin synthase catalytic subunit
MKKKIQVQEKTFDLSSEYDQLRSVSLKVGGVVTFTGTVRDFNQDASVQVLHLEHYPGMTERELDKITDEAAQRWDIIAATVIHRVGDLYPGDEIVFVGMASQHRGDAFASCSFVMDYLKTRATLWKKEKTGEGARWLTTRDSDVAAAGAWDKSQQPAVEAIKLPKS